MQEMKTIYVPDELGDDAHAFLAQYNLFASVYCGNTDRPGQRRAKRIVCRYCNRSAPQTSFSNISHGIPQFTGNTGYIAVDECDQCNEMFSVYESDLAHFLGVSRTGWNNDGTLEYFDPQTGTYINTSISNLINLIKVNKRK